MNRHMPLSDGKRPSSRAPTGVLPSNLCALVAAFLVASAVGVSAPDSSAAGATDGGALSLHYLTHPIPGAEPAGAGHQVAGRLEAANSRTLPSLARAGTFIGGDKPLRPGDVLLYGTEESDPLAAVIWLGEGRLFLAHAPGEEARRLATDSRAAEEHFLGARRLIGGRDGEAGPRERFIAEGLKYLEVTYEFGSRRSSTRTMDCSDFVRRAYHDATGEWLPGNSRTQAAHVSERSETTTDWRELRPGDLMFFTQAGNSERIGHVSIYIGEGHMLHTYSVRSGGVRIDAVRGQWDRRFHSGGSVFDDGG